MFNKFKLVAFKDGTYGVRRGWIIKEFLDLKEPRKFTWHLDNNRDKYCKGNREQAEYALILYEDNLPYKSDNGTIV